MGSVRTLNFRGSEHDDYEDIETLLYDFNLESNSGLFMLDSTNDLFCHGIIKSKTCTKPRYSLTFRKNLLGTLPYPENMEEYKNVINHKPLVYYHDGSTNVEIIKDKLCIPQENDLEWKKDENFWNA